MLKANKDGKIAKSKLELFRFHNQSSGRFDLSRKPQQMSPQRQSLSPDLNISNESCEVDDPVQGHFNVFDQSENSQINPVVSRGLDLSNRENSFRISRSKKVVENIPLPHFSNTRLV